MARPSEEFVHELHRRLRRRRLEHRLAHRLMGATPSKAAEALGIRLRELERALGELRNRQLAHLHLEAEASASSDPELRTAYRRAARFLDAEVRERAVEARWLAQNSRRLLLDRRLVDPVPRLRKLPAARWEAEGGRRASQARRRLRRALREPTPENLHQLRLRLRRIELHRGLRTNQARPRGSASERFDEVVLRLGEIHDLDVLGEVLGGAPAGRARDQLLRGLERRRRQRWKRLRPVLRSKRFRRTLAE